METKTVNILDILELNDLPEVEKQKVIASISEVINNRVMARFISMITDEEKKGLLDLKTDEPDLVESYLRRVIPDFDVRIENMTEQESYRYANELEERKTSINKSVQQLSKGE